MESAKGRQWEVCLDTSNPGPIDTIGSPAKPAMRLRAIRGARNVALAAASIAALFFLGNWIYDRFTHVYEV